MTNKQVYKANKILKQKAEEKNLSANGIYRQLNAWFKDEDKGDVITDEGFRSQWRRILDLKKNRERNTNEKTSITVKMTKATLFALDLLRVLEIDPKEYLEEILKESNEGEEEIIRFEEEMKESTGFDDILESIEELKELLMVEKQGKYHLRKRIQFIKIMLVQLEFLYKYEEETEDYKIIKQVQKISVSKEIKKYVPWYKTDIKMLRRMEQKTKDIIYKTEKTEQELDRIETYLNIYLSYSILLFSIDLLEQYKEMRNKKIWKKINAWYFNAFFPVLVENQHKRIIEIILETLKGGEKEEGLKKFFRELFEKYILSENDIKFSRETEELLKIEIEFFYPIFMYIEENKKDEPIFFSDDTYSANNKRKRNDYFIKIWFSKDISEKTKEFKENVIEKLESIIMQIGTGGKPMEKMQFSLLQQKALDFVGKTFKEKIDSRFVSPIVALGMGAGKTRVACFEILSIWKKYKDEINSYILIVAPANVIPEWESEMRKCGMAAPKNLTGHGRDLKYGLEIYDGRICITSYDTIINDIEYYKQRPPFMIIYDELHLINNKKKVQKRFFELAELNANKDVYFKMGLTGTPSQNSVDEFYMNYVFFHESKKYLKETPKLFSDNEKKQITEKLVSNNLYFFGNADINIKVNQIIVPIMMGERHFNGMIEMRKNGFHNNTIRQYLTCPSSVKSNNSNNNRKKSHIQNRVKNLKIDTEVESTKFKFVKELVKGIPEKDKIIIFSYYSEPLKYLKDQLKGAIVITGKKDESDSKELLDDFKSKEGKTRILLTTIKKSGTGENFNSANHLVLLDPWWNPMSVLQTLYRIIRKRQSKNVNIYLPMYFEVASVSSRLVAYMNRYEAEVWNNMRGKIDDYNAFLCKIIGDKKRLKDSVDSIAKKEKLEVEIENWESGKKELPNSVLNDLIIFDAETEKRIIEDEKYIFDRVTCKNEPKNLGEFIYDVKATSVSSYYVTRDEKNTFGIACLGCEMQSKYPEQFSASLENANSVGVVLEEDNKKSEEDEMRKKIGDIEFTD